MNLKNPKNPINKALQRYIKSKDKLDFNSFYDILDEDALFKELSDDFPALWKLAIVYGPEGGLSALKNDILLEIYKEVEKGRSPDSINEIFSRQMLRYLKKNPGELALDLPKLLEYSFSISYRDFFEFEKIDQFSNFILMEIFSVIYETLYSMIQEDHLLILYHLLLLLSKEQICEITGRGEFTKSLMEEMNMFRDRVEKAGIFSLISIFVRGVGDLEEFTGLLSGNHLLILQERVNNKKSYDTIDSELEIPGTREHLYRQLNTYIKELDLMEEILEEDEKIKLSGALWKILNPALAMDQKDFVAELFEKESARREFSKKFNPEEFTWGVRRKLEQEFNFPYGYIEQYRFNTPVIDLLSGL